MMRPVSPSDNNDTCTYYAVKQGKHGLQRCIFLDWADCQTFVAAEDDGGTAIAVDYGTFDSWQEAVAYIKPSSGPAGNATSRNLRNSIPETKHKRIETNAVDDDYHTTKTKVCKTAVTKEDYALSQDSGQESVRPEKGTKWDGNWDQSNDEDYNTYIQYKAALIYSKGVEKYGNSDGPNCINLHRQKRKCTCAKHFFQQQKDKIGSVLTLFAQLSLRINPLNLTNMTDPYMSESYLLFFTLFKLIVGNTGGGSQKFAPLCKNNLNLSFCIHGIRHVMELPETQKNQQETQKNEKPSGNVRLFFSRFNEACPEQTKMINNDLFASYTAAMCKRLEGLPTSKQVLDCLESDGVCENIKTLEKKCQPISTMMNMYFNRDNTGEIIIAHETRCQNNLLIDLQGTYSHTVEGRRVHHKHGAYVFSIPNRLEYLLRDLKGLVSDAIGVSCRGSKLASKGVNDNKNLRYYSTTSATQGICQLFEDLHSASGARTKFRRSLRAGCMQKEDNGQKEYEQTEETEDSQQKEDGKLEFSQLMYKCMAKIVGEDKMEQIGADFLKGTEGSRRRSEQDMLFRYDMGYLITLPTILLQCPHTDFKAEQICDWANKGHYAFVGFMGLEKEGMWIRIWKDMDMNSEKKMSEHQGTFVYIPYMSLFIIPMTLLHAGAIRVSPTGSLRSHFYFYVPNGESKMTTAKGHVSNEYITKLGNGRTAASLESCFGTKNCPVLEGLCKLLFMNEF